MWGCGCVWFLGFLEVVGLLWIECIVLGGFFRFIEVYKSEYLRLLCLG